MILFPNAAGQTATFFTNAPDYVDVSAGSVLINPVCVGTISARAAAEAWPDGSLIGVRVAKDDDNYQIWTGIWTSSNSRITASIVENSVGTIDNADTVNVFACPTKSTLRLAMAQLAEQTTVLISGTTYAITEDDAGKMLCCTASSDITLTVSSSVPTAFQCLVVREGTGTPKIDCQSGDTINNLSPGTGVTIESRWKSAYVYRRTSGQLVCIA